MSNHSTTLRYWLGKHNAGDPAAMNELLRFSQDRVLDYIRLRIQAFRRLGPYVDSQDVLVGVQLRVFTGFQTEPFKDLLHFLCLTARLARNQMVDFIRRYFGPNGPGSHERHLAPDASDPVGRVEPADPGRSPEALVLRAELEEVIEALPPEHRQVFDLLYCNRMSRADAAEALGVALSTLDRRWVLAREAFLDRYGTDLPP